MGDAAADARERAARRPSRTARPRLRALLDSPSGRACDGRPVRAVTRDALRDLDPRVPILDATGRAAVSAARATGRGRRWCRACSMSAAASPNRPAPSDRRRPVRLRLPPRERAQGLVLGVVGRGEWVRAGIDAVLAGLAEVAPWMVADVPAGAVAPGRSGAASTQWAVPGARALLLGDAALARDALASQGLACRAVRCGPRSVSRVRWVRVRSAERPGHPADGPHPPRAACRRLEPFLPQSPGWREYRAFLYAVSAEPSSPVSLDQGNSNTL